MDGNDLVSQYGRMMREMISLSETIDAKVNGILETETEFPRKGRCRVTLFVEMGKGTDPVRTAFVTDRRGRPIYSVEDFRIGRADDGMLYIFNGPLRKGGNYIGLGEIGSIRYDITL